jgi:coenzyme F420-reducing hydrogenase delta subunit/ferredoxin
MIPHQDKPGMRQAQVDPDLCTACGICEGSCPSATPFRHVEELISGIEVPDYPLDALRRQADEAIDSLQGQGLVLFGCDHALDASALVADDVAVVSLPCSGALPPSFADFIARKDQVLGVMISGCHAGDCYFRKGSEWSEQRLSGERMPHLRTGAGRKKVRISWAGPHDRAALEEEMGRFRRELLEDTERTIAS